MCAEYYKTRLLYQRCYGCFGWRKKARQYNPLVAQVHPSVNKSLLPYCGLVLASAGLQAASETLRSHRF
ncbi:hypothetical protein AFK24_17370 [Pseudomonas syringae]|uniref:Uncharacterized protein n=1 Tax=Pseudomonas syringae TaxID=317 RepID=A0A1C7Z1B3_PSESX|nr:hypothetical protein AFK24_17370 [Pseudomonas syringae]